MIRFRSAIFLAAVAALVGSAIGQSVPWGDLEVRVVVQPNRTNHPHDLASSEAVVALLSEVDVEVVGEASGLDARHRSWDRAAGEGGSPTGSPGRLPGDLEIVVRETANVTPREIYGVALNECTLELVASVRTIRDGRERSRLEATGSAIESSVFDAHDRARADAMATLGGMLVAAVEEASMQLRSGRLGVYVESVDGELDGHLGRAGGGDPSLRLLDDGIDGLDGIDAVTLTPEQWRTLAETGLVVLDRRPGWVLVSVEEASTASWPIALLLLAVGSVVIGVALRRRMARR